MYTHPDMTNVTWIDVWKWSWELCILCLLWFVQVTVRAMARGQQKIQSQQKNAKKAAEKKKSQGADQKSAAKAALVHTCPVCRVSGQCYEVLFLLYLARWLTDQNGPSR